MVLIVVDQFGSSSYRRYHPILREGFYRLQKEGTLFLDVHHEHAATVTCAGHATIATGVSPRFHGIVENDWYDVEKRKEIYCADDNKGGLSAENLLVPTIGDLLKEKDKRSLVYGISGKDRSAIYLSGKKADGAIWLESKEDRDWRTLQGALNLIDEKQLGKDKYPDLLAISFSDVDIVGHRYGSESKEAKAAILKVDKYLNVLLKKISSKVGKDNALVIVTADHGVAASGGQLGIETLECETRAKVSVAKELQIEELFLDGYYLRKGDFNREQLATLLRRKLLQCPKIASVYTRHLSKEALSLNDKIYQRFQNSDFAERSPDFTVLYAPGFYQIAPPQVTTHGTPWDYDSQVPLFIWGKWDKKSWLKKGVKDTRDIFTIIGNALGVF